MPTLRRARWGWLRALGSQEIATLAQRESPDATRMDIREALSRSTLVRRVLNSLSTPGRGLGRALVVPPEAEASAVAMAVTGYGARTQILRSPGLQLVVSAPMTKGRTASRQLWLMLATTGTLLSAFASRRSRCARAARIPILWDSVRRSLARMVWRSRLIAPVRRRTTNAPLDRFVLLMGNASRAMVNAHRGRHADLMELARRTPTAMGSLIPLGRMIRIRSRGAIAAVLRQRAAVLPSCADKQEFNGESIATLERTAISRAEAVQPCRFARARNAMRWSMRVS